MSKKDARHRTIESIVRNESVRTQREIVERLAERGFVCTQATASRDIAELGLYKSPEGYYVVRAEHNLSRLVYELVSDVERVSNFCVIRTKFGSAIEVADAIDRARLDDVVGTIAGKDTVLAICASDESAARIESHLQSLTHGREGER